MESRDHKSTRVLSTTSDEESRDQDQSQRENDIVEVIDTITEDMEIREDAIDAGDKAEQLSDSASQNMVFEICIFTFDFCVMGLIISFLIIAASHLFEKSLRMLYRFKKDNYI